MCVRRASLDLSARNGVFRYHARITAPPASGPSVRGAVRAARRRRPATASHTKTAIILVFVQMERSTIKTKHPLSPETPDSRIVEANMIRTPLGPFVPIVPLFLFCAALNGCSSAGSSDSSDSSNSTQPAPPPVEPIVPAGPDYRTLGVNVGQVNYYSS